MIPDTDDALLDLTIGLPDVDVAADDGLLALAKAVVVGAYMVGC